MVYSKYKEKYSAFAKMMQKFDVHKQYNYFICIYYTVLKKKLLLVFYLLRLTGIVKLRQHQIIKYTYCLNSVNISLTLLKLY